MKKVNVNELEMGMIIGKAVYANDGSILLTPGTVIESRHVKEIIASGIEVVEVMHCQGEPCTESCLDKMGVAQTVRTLFNDISLTNEVEQVAVKKTVNDILRQVLTDRCLLLNLTEVRAKDNYIFTHSVNVCMLSLIMGLFLKLKGEQLKNLGTAALLHDVGRTQVPEGILYKPAPLTDEEFQIVKKHPIHSYEMLKAYNEFPEDVLLTALQHHERLDGSGYPYGLKGDQINSFARIVAIADVFDALLADRPFRKAFFPHQAVEIIINSTGQFDLEILQLFVENVVIYPLGSVVTLNNGEIGVVVDMNKGQQARPVVRIVYGSDGQRLNFIREIDLSKSQELYISKVIREEQMEKFIG